MKWTLGQIIDWLGHEAELCRGEPGLEVTGVCTDSREVKPGDLFVAIRGERHDGHRFVDEARRRGAAAALISRPVTLTPGSAAFGLVRLPSLCTRRALGELARKRRTELEMDLRCVAVTGSAGKTTTKDMIAHLLGAAGPTLKSEASFNNEIGLPLTIFQARPEHRFAVLEIGSNRPGEIRRLAEIAAPHIGVITSIGPAHLEGLGSIEGVACEKSELLGALPASGLAVLPAECPQLEFLIRRNRGAAPVRTFGLVPDADITGRMVPTAMATREAATFVLNGNVPVTLALPGLHNVRNALAAAAVGLALGLDEQTCAERLATFQPPAERSAVESVAGVTLIDDAYNANPLSFTTALDILARFPNPSRRVVVAGDMLELGDGSVPWHRRLGRQLAQVGIGRLITVGDVSRETGRAAVRAGLAPARWRHLRDAPAAALAVAAILRDGDTVLVKGSRGVRLGIVSEAIRQRARETAQTEQTATTRKAG